MCNPLAIGSAALTAFGTYKQYQSQQKAQDRINQAISQNDERNEALRRQSQGQVLNQADQFTREKFDANQAAETEKLDRSYTDNLSQGDMPGEFYGGRMSENTRVLSDQKSSEATDFSKEIASALARMRGFESGMRVNNTGINRAAETAAMNSNFIGGNNAVLPLQIEAAKQSGSNPLADIMVGVGSAGVSAGLSGGSGPMTTSLADGDKIIWNTGRNGVPYNTAQKFFGGLV